MRNSDQESMTRRRFVELAGIGGAVLGVSRAGAAQADQGGRNGPDTAPTWEPFSERKVRVGIAGFGHCRFGAAFGFQDHPNVEVVAVTDLIAERRAGLAQACRCEKTYTSCEEMLQDDTVEAVFLATDAPSHARLAIAALEHGKHVASTVPAVYGSLEDAERLFEAVQKSGLHYMMFETSCFHADLYAWRQRYLAGAFGKLVYSEGEDFHYFPQPAAGYNPKTGRVDTDGWRKGFPPQWYPTHASAYHIGVTGGSFTEVSCMGMPSIVPHFQPENNDYDNPFGSEVALFRTSDGGMARMAVSWDTPSGNGEKGRIYGQKYANTAVPVERPPLPPGMAGYCGGSLGYLTSEFIDAILHDRTPWIDVAQSLNMTVAGIVAHQSALRDGELLKIPQYAL